MSSLNPESIETDSEIKTAIEIQHQDTFQMEIERLLANQYYIEWYPRGLQDSRDVRRKAKFSWNQEIFIYLLICGIWEWL